MADGKTQMNGEVLRATMWRATLFLALLLSFLVTTLSPFWSDETTNLPRLPHTVPDSFPLSLREKVQSAYAAALARPQDALANGRLCMILQAYNKSDERAEDCYQRAHQLDPASFRWAYYLGSVQMNRGKHK